MKSPTVLLRAASALVMLALLVELGSLFWSHPLSFIVFATVGGGALGLGLLIYVYWLLVGRPEEEPTPPATKE